MGLVLGLDGGGSKTLIALATRDGDVVRLERALGLDPAQGPRWKTRLRDLLERAGAFDADLDGAAFGLSAHGEIAAQDAEQTAAVAALAGPDAVVDNDVRIAFDGAFAGGGGVLLLAGTGSMAWASDGTSGRHVRVGGWGEPFGDEGSAFWIGREALGLATRALDGRQPGAAAFAEALLARIDVHPQGLCAWIAGHEDRRAGFASLARIVSDLAEAGQIEARTLLEAAAGHLAEHAEAAWRALGGDRAIGWSYAGSVFSSSILRTALAERIGTAPLRPRLPPVGGALLRAAETAGWPVGEAFVERLALSLAPHLEQKLSPDPQP